MVFGNNLWTTIRWNPIRINTPIHHDQGDGEGILPYTQQLYKSLFRNEI